MCGMCPRSCIRPIAGSYLGRSEFTALPQTSPHQMDPVEVYIFSSPSLARRVPSSVGAMVLHTVDLEKAAAVSTPDAASSSIFDLIQSKVTLRPSWSFTEGVHP